MVFYPTDDNRWETCCVCGYAGAHAGGPPGDTNAGEYPLRIFRQPQLGHCPNQNPLRLRRHHSSLGPYESHPETNTSRNEAALTKMGFLRCPVKKMRRFCGGVSLHSRHCCSRGRIQRAAPGPGLRYTAPNTNDISVPRPLQNNRDVKKRNAWRVRQSAGAATVACFLKTGITSVAKVASCSQMTRCGVPMTDPTLISSSPGYRS